MKWVQINNSGLSNDLTGYDFVAGVTNLRTDVESHRHSHNDVSANTVNKFQAERRISEDAQCLKDFAGDLAYFTASIGIGSNQ